MGLFTSSPPPPPVVAPARTTREACWTSRDLYFNCLTEKKVNIPGQEGKGDCLKERKGYEGECAKSWVDYFNKRRVIQLRQDLMEQQAKEQRESSGIPITSNTVPVGGKK